MQRIAFSMKTQESKMDVIANNIANANTRAYKKEALTTRSFGEYMLNAIENNKKSPAQIPVGAISLGVGFAAHRSVFTQGDLQETGYSTDFAINGDGFFVLETPDGLQYTRAGNFTFDDEGYLVSQGTGLRGYVLSEDGRIQSLDRNIQIDKNGFISGGGRLRIQHFNDLGLLTKEAGGNYTNTDPQNISQQGSYTIMQRYLEASNVNVIDETRDMLVVKRNYESCQQIIRMMDDTLGKAANDIARL
jgi:flagellar basal-body rod protein FlgG